MTADLSSISFTSESGTLTRRLRECDPSAMLNELDVAVD